MAPESTQANQLSRLQFLGVVLVFTVIGGAILSALTPDDDPSVKEAETIKTIPILPEYPGSRTGENQPPAIAPQRPRTAQTRRGSTPEPIVLVPETQAQVDCVLGGGGIACFDEDYRPNYPRTSNQQEWEDWEQNREREEDRWKSIFQ